MVANVFDAAFYAAKNQDLGRAGLTTEAQLSQHFQNFGLAEGRAFSPYVDLRFYASCNSDLAAAGLTSNAQLYEHLTNFGIREKRVISQFVDLGFYDANNPDLAVARLTNGEQLFDHLRQFGIREGRTFSRNFSDDVYFSENQDLAVAFNGDVQQGFGHLQLFGLDEGRRFASNFDARVYATTNTDLGAAGITSTRDLLSHYIKFGRNEGRQGAAVIIGGAGDILEGTSRQDTFRLVGAGATINNFSLTGNDRVEIFSYEPTTFLDGVSRFLPLIQNIDGGARLLAPTPDGSATLTTNFATINGTGVNAGVLSNTPEAFRFVSAGNVVTEWNELTFDAARVAGVPPAASTRYFALVQTAINDAVQGVLNNPNRNTYLQSIGKVLPTLAAGVGRDDATASIAAAAAAERVLNRLFTDPDSPVVFNFSGATPTARTFTPVSDAVGTAQEIRTYFPRIFADALEDTISRFSSVGQAAIAAARAFGESIGQAIIDERANDGAFRNAAGQRVNPAALATEYLDGIESQENLSEVGGQDQQGANAPQRDASGGSLLNDGTVGRKSDGTNYIGTGAAIKTRDSNGATVINGTAATTPGAWRRGEDTLGANGQFAGLASIEVADINKAWVLPSTNFFNDNVLPPPALDSDRYRNDVAEIYSEGSILDLPQYGTNTQVSVANRTTTVNGETSFATGALGAAINDTNASDNPLVGTGVKAYRGDDFGETGTDGIGRTSEERTIIGHVWANAEGTYGPNYAWQKVAQQLAINNGSSLADTAYVFAALDVALADGFINIWDIKWDEDYFWRPVSSVRNADELPTTAGIDDNSWTPREVTPQHPCHPSGTSMTAGVASTVLAEFYGNNQTFTVSADPHPSSTRLSLALTSLNGNAQLGANGPTLDRVTRKYTSLSQAADESRISRIYAGAHFRFATENGINMGEQVARYFLRHNPFVKNETMSVPMTNP
jgi:Vanadium chloroperoxidase N-terminal domain